ncbi:transposase, partial [Citricoccus zhacaiensis]
MTIAWRDLPSCFGPWQTVWKSHRRFSTHGTWDAILTTLLGTADA